MIFFFKSDSGDSYPQAKRGAALLLEGANLGDTEGFLLYSGGRRM